MHLGQVPAPPNHLVRDLSCCISGRSQSPLTTGSEIFPRGFRAGPGSSSPRVRDLPRCMQGRSQLPLAMDPGPFLLDLGPIPAPPNRGAGTFPRLHPGQVSAPPNSCRATGCRPPDLPCKPARGWALTCGPGGGGQRAGPPAAGQDRCWGAPHAARGCCVATSEQLMAAAAVPPLLVPEPEPEPGWQAAATPACRSAPAGPRARSYSGGRRAAGQRWRRAHRGHRRGLP